MAMAQQGMTPRKRGKKPTSFVLRADIHRRLRSGCWNRTGVVNAALLWFLDNPEIRDTILAHYAGHSGRTE